MLVMKYGLRPPTLNAQMVHEQMRYGHEYKNTLIEIERGRKTAIRTLLGRLGNLPSLEQAAKEANEHAAAMTAKINAYKSEHRTRKVPEELRQALDEARIAKREASQKWKAAQKAEKTPDIQAEIDRINGLANELCKSAYNHSPCFWGTKVQVVGKAMDAVRKAPYWGVKRRGVWYPLEPNNPSFLRWTGEGQVGVQIQGGLRSELVFFDDTRLQIEKVPDRFGREDAPWAMLRLRIGSNGRDPIWAEWPMKMHRHLPPGKIKGAVVILTKIGPREEWSVDLTVDNDPIIRPSGYGSVAVNLGWRRVDGGIRVAYAVDEEGTSEELVIDDGMIASLQKAEDLESIRDIRFKEAREWLSQWLKDNESPKWILARTRTMHAWRSQKRLASLVLYWRENRFDGDAEAYEALERWRYRDHHLWSWESDQRVKSRRRRLDMYRVWAAKLAERYHRIILNHHNMSQTARKPKPEDDNDNDIARSNRHLVAVSTLKLALINSKTTRNGETVELPKLEITKPCYKCGSLESFDAAKNVQHTCSQCKTFWDQDYNACRNVLKAYFERPSEAKIVGTARKVENRNEDGTLKENRRERIRRLAKEKETRQRTSRNTGCNPSELATN